MDFSCFSLDSFLNGRVGRTLASTILPLIDALIEHPIEKFSHVKPEDLVLSRPLLGEVRWALNVLMEKLSHVSQISRRKSSASWDTTDEACRQCYKETVTLHQYAWTQLHSQPWQSVELFWRRIYGIASYVLSSLCILEIYVLLHSSEGNTKIKERVRKFLQLMGVDGLEEVPILLHEASGTGTDVKCEFDNLLDRAAYYGDMGLIMGGFAAEHEFDVPIKNCCHSCDERTGEGDELHLGMVCDALQLLFVSGHGVNTEHSTIPFLESVFIHMFGLELPVDEFDEVGQTNRDTALEESTKVEIQRSIPSEHNLTLNDFAIKYLKPQQPVVVRGGCCHWPAIEKWKNIRKRLLECGGRRLVPVEIGSSYTQDQWSQKIITIRQFTELYLSPQPTDVGYLAQHPLLNHMPELQDEFLTPDFCSAGTSHFDDIIRLAWIGPSSTMSPFHTDPHQNLFAQISGYKYIRLISSEFTSRMYPYKTMLSNTSSIAPADIINYPVNLDRYPNFPSDDYLDIILEPGDLLFIPYKWWHFIKSLTPSVSVSYWFDDESVY